MVTWGTGTATGGISGIGRRNEPTLQPDGNIGPRKDGAVFFGGAVGKFATPGTVDTNIITRLQYAVPKPTPESFYLDMADGLFLSCSMSFSSGDVAAAPGKRYGVTAFLLKASDFAGKPTPEDIYLSALSKVYRSAGYITGAQDNVGFSCQIPSSEFVPNTKYWVLYCPVSMPNSTTTPSNANDVPIGGPVSGATLNGRALSFWTNRTPGAPTITSPSSGQVVSPGKLITMSYKPNDPDGLPASTGDYQPWGFADVAGLQVQYAPRATKDNPSPLWIDLPFATREVNPSAGPGWYLQDAGADLSKGTTPDTISGLKTLRDTGSVQIQCGSQIMTSGAGILPSGDWQIRMRTFDFGHPFSTLRYNPDASIGGYRVQPGFGPLGAKGIQSPPGAGAYHDNNYTPANYPATNRSPWSTPVNISVSIQVPQPIAIEPSNATAIREGDEVILQWQYRNTASPAYNQARRAVQIRKVGEANWTTLVSGNKTDRAYSIQNPQPNDAAPVAPPAPVRTEYFVDPGFEAGTVDNWETNSPGVLANVTPPTGAVVVDDGTSVTGWAGTWSSGSGSGSLTVGTSGSAVSLSNPSTGGPRGLAVTRTGAIPVTSTRLLTIDWQVGGGSPASFTVKGDGVDLPKISESASPVSGYTRTVVRVPSSIASSISTLAFGVVIGPFVSPTASGITFDSISRSADGNVPHSGTHSLLMQSAPTPTSVEYPFRRRFTLLSGHTYFTVDGWVKKSAATTRQRLLIWFLDDTPAIVGTTTVEGTATDGWINLYARDLVRPPNATQMWVQVVQITGDNKPVPGDSIDDFSLLGSNAPYYATAPPLNAPPPVDPDQAPVAYTLEATTQYEWRVRVADTNYATSPWSTPARFWIVPQPDSGDYKSDISAVIDGAQLGVGKHRVLVYRRGGQKYVGELTNLSYVDWNRLRDDISDARIVVSGWDEDGGNLLAKLQTWAYEIVIYRNNGYTTDRVWEGPITLLTYDEGNGSVTINAKDVIAYPYRRIVRQPMDDSAAGDTVVNRAQRVLQNSMAPDDPNVLAYLTLVSDEADAMQYRSMPEFSRTAYEEIDDMAANAGLDYCAVGRRIILWGTRNRIGTLPEFTNKNLGAFPIVSEYGMNMANFYAISDGNGVHGEATRLDEFGEDEVYGNVEMLSSSWASNTDPETGTYTEEGLEKVRLSFSESAEKTISTRFPPPVIVRIPDNTTLNPNTVLSIQQLVPGVVIPLRANGKLRSVVGNQKLDSMKVIQQNGKETITITLSPFNYDDIDAGGEL